MKVQSQKGILESLPRDVNRQTVLKTLLDSDAPVRTRELVDMARSANPELNIDARLAAEIVKSWASAPRR